MKIIHLTILLILALSIHVQSKQIYMANVFRHGARYPVNNMYDGKQTAKFHGNLTSVGLRQQYLLGNYFKYDYINNSSNSLLNATLHPRQVQIFTLTDAPRCIQSAYAHALGMFPFGQGQTIDSSIPQQLLEPPFQTIFPDNLKSQNAPDGQDNFALQKGFQPVPIRFGNNFFPSCPNEALILAKRGQSAAQQIAEFQAQFALFNKQICAFFNISVAECNLAGLVALYDTLVCDYYLGRPMPVRWTEQDFQKLKFIQRYMFTIVYENQPSRTFNAPFVTAMLNNMLKATQGKLFEKKLSLYSAHDTNVLPLMVFFNLTSSDCLKKQYKNQTVTGNCAVPIPFASNIYFELHQNDNNQTDFFVKVRYNGVYYNLCGRNSTQCSFDQFSEKSKAYLMDFNKQCGTKVQDQVKSNYLQSQNKNYKSIRQNLVLIQDKIKIFSKP